ncbi:type II toxin-antitoxin system RelE/ParE family toxin [Desulfatirhabdium butyrativorans]
MARTVEWTEAAADDLDEAASFINRDSPYYAAAFVREVKQAAKSLQFFF